MAIQVIYELTNAQVTDLMALYHSTWWASDRTLADIRTMLANTDLVVALAEHPSGQLVGFSRILTDGIYRGVIYDVIIAEDYRGQGLGKTLMEAMLSYPPVQSISHLALYCTSEMMPFYERWGFVDQTNKICLMGITQSSLAER